MNKILDLAQSLHPQSKRYRLILIILQKIFENQAVSSYLETLKKLSVQSGSAMEISLKAKQIIVHSQLPSNQQRKEDLLQTLSEIHQILDQEERSKKIQSIARQANEISDLLIPHFNHPLYGPLAMELYVRHSYRSYYVEDSNFTKNDQFNYMEWHFYISLPSSSPTYSANSPPTFNHIRQSSSSPGMSIMTGLQSMLRTDSTDSLSNIEDHTKLRYGMMVHFENELKFQDSLSLILKSYNNNNIQNNNNNNGNGKGHKSQLSRDGNQGESTDILSVVLNIYPETISDETKVINSITTILKGYSRELSLCRIRRITLICSGDIGKPLKFFTFRERHLYSEDPIFRHIEPAMAYHLEVRKLSNFDISHIPTQSQRIHLYYAQEKGKRETDPDADRCFFVRSVIRYSDLYGSNEIKVDILLSQVESLLSESIESLEMAMVNKRYERAQNHSIFVNIMPEVMFDERMIGYVVQEIGDRLGKKLWKLRVGRVEVRGKIRKENTLIPVRFFVQNPTGYAFQVQCYYEQMNPLGQHVFAVVPGSSRGMWEGLPVDTPYPIMDAVQRNRFKAQRLDTTYVYDFPDLFREALQNNWMEYMDQHKKNPNKVSPPVNHGVLECVELILSLQNCKTDHPPQVPFDQLPQDQRPTLEETYRPLGYNDIGMVAWRMTFYTPEYPKGRQAIVISNDITFQTGTFGPQEDLLFKLASEMARLEGIPRIYLSSNSGARIGLADEVKSKYQVIWNNPLDHSKGIKDLYLTTKDYLSMQGFIKAYQDPQDEDRWILTDIIGQKNGIGVENLSWSGLIAGETSQAYNEIFTISLVTGRSVGIGAYLVRLGQRTIQNDAPIILTGASALNKVLGKEVYESNQQLGGVQIMYPNGVSHLAVNDELRGIQSILSWLSFVPKSRGDLVPIMSPIDLPDRLIEFDPTYTQKYDTRCLLGGFQSPHDPKSWVSGFFDKDTFIETLGGWANTVITGRARLGGIPMGIIAVEMKSVEKVIPADPANPLSQEQVSSQAGQVWYPDSSFKTAQAIQDFNHGEELPLMIFANWRGFSGGMRDMFDEILKFGSMIVDNLREYKQPVFVYIPPGGELRGGAWVVLDSTINLDMMEMYASETARGGVLEPNGICEIKYRDPELIKTMHRLDPKLQEWDKEIGLATSINGGLDQNQRNIKQQIQQREKELLGIYQQIAIKFADLHDTPGRMKAKGVIHEVIPWKESRKYFYHRLKRRLYEERQLKLMDKVHPNLPRKQRLDLLNEWISDIHNSNCLNGDNLNGDNLNNAQNLIDFQDNEFISNFLIKNLHLLNDKTNDLSRDYIQNQIINFAQTDTDSTLDAFHLLFNNLSNDQKKLLLSKINNNNFDNNDDEFIQTA
ncbi:acetyl-CoA carboxylase [Tieghemostelium lacteum]|uniref:Acetyl-CoA carboxylase n=1 Tax=Tieghemostelium lacteum TaxID=361077 RepID=A0A151ZIH8_TIELA|nr:acetyl-CoA carboxylase [Tieghemostelium lacteum]|eukprot:KYQ93773.1 acetyl-CoA carboxylase [Tieghemostelium lacteum]